MLIGRRNRGDRQGSEVSAIQEMCRTTESTGALNFFNGIPFSRIARPRETKVIGPCISHASLSSYGTTSAARRNIFMGLLKMRYAAGDQVRFARMQLRPVTKPLNILMSTEY